MPPEIVIVPLVPSLLPPMPAPPLPPVTVSAPEASPGAWVTKSVCPAATSRPARSMPEASEFAPARKSDTTASPSSEKAHWWLLVAASVKFESVTSLVTFDKTRTCTSPSTFSPEIVNGPAFVSMSMGAAYVHPAPVEPASSSSTPLTLTPTGAAGARLAAKTTASAAAKKVWRADFMMELLNGIRGLWHGYGHSMTGARAGGKDFWRGKRSGFRGAPKGWRGGAVW